MSNWNRTVDPRGRCGVRGVVCWMRCRVGVAAIATRCRRFAYICSCDGSGLRDAKCAVESCCSCRWSCCSWLSLYWAPSVRYSFQAGFLRGVLLVVDGVEIDEVGTRKLELTLR